jgi:NhaA family Na+:H+ antiporter
MNKHKDPTIIGGILEPFQRFFRVEASGGIVLMISTLTALILANSAWGETYLQVWENKFTIGLGNFKLSKSLLHWINDGFMAIFFFVVGLEIKRELIAGELSSVKQASLPIAAAIGGMVVPAGMYILLNQNPESASGWGIPMATDIAFSLGILSLLGKRVPIALKVFLVAFAIVDDLGAVLIIALFYSEDIHWNYLLIGLSLIVILIIFNRLQIISVHPYMAVGWIIWFMFLKSGIHPTIAGVLIAFTIPVNRTINLRTFKNDMQDNLDYFCYNPKNTSLITLNHQQLAAISNMQNRIFHVQSPVQRLEHGLHGFVTYIVMPVFALANASVVLKGISFTDLFSGVSGAIEISLVAGKVLGIFIFSWLSVKIGLAKLPENVHWKHIISLGFLGGMGFTMSLFISNLAFTSEALLTPAKIGILTGSLIAGVGGYILLLLTLKKNSET